MFNPKLSSQCDRWSYVSISTLIALAQVVISGFTQSITAQAIIRNPLGISGRRVMDIQTPNPQFICQGNNNQTTLEFFIIGRGGLPPTPEDLLNSEVIIAEWMPLNLENTIELPTKPVPEAINQVTLFRGCQRSLIYYTNAGLNSLPPYNPPKLGGMGNLQFISPQS